MSFMCKILSKSISIATFTAIIQFIPQSEGEVIGYADEIIDLSPPSSLCAHRQ